MSSGKKMSSALFDVRDLSNPAAGLHHASLSVNAGEIVGLAGLTGSGRTQFAETVFGITPAESGEIRVNGAAPVRARTPHQAMAAGIGYVPEDRRRHGMVLGMPVAANTSMAMLQAVSKHGLIDRPAERSIREACSSAGRPDTCPPRATPRNGKARCGVCGREPIWSCDSTFAPPTSR